MLTDIYARTMMTATGHDPARFAPLPPATRQPRLVPALRHLRASLQRAARLLRRPKAPAPCPGQPC